MTDKSLELKPLDLAAKAEAGSGLEQPGLERQGLDQAVQVGALGVVIALGFSHFLNDMIQSLVFAMYPILQITYTLSLTQIGIITAAYQITASLLQPMVGLYIDRHPKPYLLSAGMGFTLVGLTFLSRADQFLSLLMAAVLIGMGSAVFHPESSRMARAAAGYRPGLAQSIFQVGGNLGTSAGPLLAAFVVLQHGQRSLAWFSLAALLAMLVLFLIGRWYSVHLAGKMRKRATSSPSATLPTRRVVVALGLLMLLTFSKNIYMASFVNYYTFYLIERFALSIRDAQLLLFLFLGAAAVGTLAGGPIGDLVGRKYVIWGSVLGVAPFTLALPYVGLYGTAALTVVIGFVLASAFPAIIIYAQELLPGHIGTVAGLFFGVAFGMAGLGAAALGKLADMTNVTTIYRFCAFLPLLGVCAMFLPNLGRPVRAAHHAK